MHLYTFTICFTLDLGVGVLSGDMFVLYAPFRIWLSWVFSWDMEDWDRIGVGG